MAQLAALCGKNTDINSPELITTIVRTSLPRACCRGLDHKGTRAKGIRSLLAVQEVERQNILRSGT